MKAILVIFAVFALSVSAMVQFSNPVIPAENNPDPGAIFYEGFYYVASTTMNDSLPHKFAIHKSADLQNWEYVADVFPVGYLPTWANGTSDFWAPEIHVVNGQFRVVFAARENGTGRLCVGLGYADNLLGPYTDIGAPLIRNETVGSIDAHIMALDDGTYYLVWKDDGNGNTPQIPSWIKAQQLTSDGLSVTGPVSLLLDNTLSWEAAVTEGPWILKRGDWYYLFYSGNCYCDNTYAVGVARSQNPLGPYVKKGDPILKSNSIWIGPGHCSVLPVDGEDDTYVMIYHSWYGDQVCGNYDRLLMVDYVSWVDDWPTIATSSPY